MGEVKDVWVWDPVGNEPFQHPGELPSTAQAARVFFLEKISGPKVAKISRATLIDRKGGMSGMSMIAREDGINQEVPMSRVLPWYEGLLLLQEIEALGLRVSWFTQRLRELLVKERAKRRKSLLPGSLYVEKMLMDTAVTGANYVDHNDKEHHFRRDKLKITDLPVEGDAMDGFWKVDDVVAYMPPWEAFCNPRFGLYQEFYQVRWDDFNDTDFSNVENGCADLGSTWEPDECLPPHLDGLRHREKQSWVKWKKAKELAEAEAIKAAKSKEALSPSPQAAQERPAKMGRFRRDGKPLIPDMFRLSHGHDFVPDPSLDDTNETIRSLWPRKAEDYPPGHGVADPPGFCWQNCDCMDDQRGQKRDEMRKMWLEDAQRTTDVLRMITAFEEDSRRVRRRGSVSKQFYLEHVQPHPAEEPLMRQSALALAAETEKEIQKAFQDLPLSALLDLTDKVQIPALAFMKPGEDYAPVRFELSAETSARSWVKIGAEDGVLSATVEPNSRPAPIRIQLHHPEALAAVIDCLVTTSPKPVWQSGTARIVSRFLDVQKCHFTRNVRIVLQERMGKIYDFDKRVAKEDIRFGEWLSCMELTLRLLRSLAFANVVKSEGASKPPPRAAVARG